MPRFPKDPAMTPPNVQSPPMPGKDDPRTDLSQLAQQAGAKDGTALARLLTEMRPWLLSQASRVLRNEYDAEDAVQETLLRVSRGVHSFSQQMGSARAWVGRILLNCIRDEFRRRRRRRVEQLA